MLVSQKYVYGHKMKLFKRGSCVPLKMLWVPLKMLWAIQELPLLHSVAHFATSLFFINRLRWGDRKSSSVLFKE